MVKRELLKSYSRAKNKEKRILLMIDEYRTRQMGSAVKYSDMPKGTDMHDLSDYMVGLEEIESMYATQMATTSKVFDIVMKALHSLDDQNEYDVLYYKYIKGMPALKIGDKLCMTEWNVYKLEKKAIEKMEVSNLDFETIDSLLAYKSIPDLRDCSISA